MNGAIIESTVLRLELLVVFKELSGKGFLCLLYNYNPLKYN